MAKIIAFQRNSVNCGKTALTMHALWTKICRMVNVRLINRFVTDRLRVLFAVAILAAPLAAAGLVDSLPPGVLILR